ncbi:MAG: hypothetical protein A2857_06245 [Candidatus Levybacteria bacterium RIFCSPHIGHO2_01_FULL_36_15]|nr:MAG: hypothetical protein A2857_06245 [Candidatus Levybacteria bacterium RIFCSPHIGHO2_01_FULL_36_15]
MRIGIDISQASYEGSGVSNFILNLVRSMIRQDKSNEYVLFFSSLRGRVNKTLSRDLKDLGSPRVKLVSYPFPPSVLDLFWNKLHILPLEFFVGDVDIFLTSDWTEPPSIKAKKITILYDLIIYKNPEETDKKIIQTQKRRLKWVKKESKLVICISESTKEDAKKILGIENERLRVVYPGI